MAFDSSAAAGELASIRRPGAPPASPCQPAADLAAGRLASSPALGLYVHFPFCGVHCPYCDFAVDARSDIPHDQYADAVSGEIAARAAWFDHGTTAPLASIYFGGGTPGLWRPDALGRVIEAGLRAFSVSPASAASLEITVEANPGEVDEQSLREFRRGGVNRLSLGLQSLDDRLLRLIGRNHVAAAGPAAIDAARAAGIDNISIDLMFALPQQSFDDWRRTLDDAVALRPAHVSAYALTIERGTVFGARTRRGDLVVPDEEEAARMQEWARDSLAAAGLKQYEVSSYARAGRQAIHNGLYWVGAPYLGVGASSSSFRPLADGGGWRFANPRGTESYLRAAREGGGSPAPANIEWRTTPDLENEAVWLSLRTGAGLDRGAHMARFGTDPVVAREAAVARCVSSGWLEVSASRLQPTPAGLLFADEVAARLWV